jgi:glutathione S-transferase
VIKLFYAPNTRATRPRWMLEELEVPYELVTLDVAGGAHRTAEYLRIHPHGQVPALLDGDVAVFESTAICMYLADRFIERGLAPPVGSPARAAYYQWLVYCPATLEPAIGLLSGHTVALPPEQRVAPVADKAREKLAQSLAVLAGVLSRRPFMLGERFGAVDLVLGANLRWAFRAGLLGSAPPVLQSYMERLLSRPAAQRAFAG